MFGDISVTFTRSVDEDERTLYLHQNMDPQNPYADQKVEEEAVSDQELSENRNFLFRTLARMEVAQIHFDSDRARLFTTQW